MTTAKDKQRCAVFLVENGQVKKRWISELAVNWPGLVPKRMVGNELPKSIILNTGADPVDVSTLEAFCSRESFHRSTKTEKKPEYPLGPVAATAALTFVGFKVLFALVDVFASQVF